LNRPLERWLPSLANDYFWVHFSNQGGRGKGGTKGVSIGKAASTETGLSRLMGRGINGDGFRGNSFWAIKKLIQIWGFVNTSGPSGPIIGGRNSPREKKGLMCTSIYNTSWEKRHECEWG